MLNLKKGSFENTEGFCDYYKSESMKRVFIKMIDDAKTKAPDYKKEFEDAKEEFDEIKSIVDKLLKLNVEVNPQKLANVDSAFEYMVQQFNNPNLYDTKYRVGEFFEKAVVGLRSEIRELKAELQSKINRKTFR